MKDFFKNISEIINNLKSTTKGKAVLFFGFYLIFFIVLFSVSSINIGSKSTGEYDVDNDDKCNFELIENNNYSFKYTNTIDLDSIIFSGERYDDLSLYKINNIYHFTDNKKYYINSNNIWVEEVNPNIFSYFTDIDNIKNIIDKSTYISKTDYKSGKVVYNYEISTTTLVKLINNIDIDLDDKSNLITISTAEDKNVNKISFVLDSYGIYSKICKVKFNIDLEYDKFGEIKEIENPIY